MMASKATPQYAPGATDILQPDAPQPDAPQPPAFTWDALEAPIAMPNKVAASNGAFDALSKIPAPIRERAERSLIVNAARVKAATTSNAKRPRVDYHWDVQRVPSIELGAEFAKLITKYAKYRPTGKVIEFAGPDSPVGQITVRCGEPQHYKTGTDGKPEACTAATEGAYIGIRYSARPFQVRTDSARTPGSA